MRIRRIANETEIISKVCMHCEGHEGGKELCAERDRFWITRE